MHLVVILDIYLLSIPPTSNQFVFKCCLRRSSSMLTFKQFSLQIRPFRWISLDRNPDDYHWQPQVSLISCGWYAGTSKKVLHEMNEWQLSRSQASKPSLHESEFSLIPAVPQREKLKSCKLAFIWSTTSLIPMPRMVALAGLVPELEFREKVCHFLRIYE